MGEFKENSFVELNKFISELNSIVEKDIAALESEMDSSPSYCFALGYHLALKEVKQFLATNGSLKTKSE